jgi:Fe-S-cluster containining protein
MIFRKDLIKKRLEKIYKKIPNNFPCRHCHKCCGQIIWFKPENIFINDYLKKYNLSKILWSTFEFEQYNMSCPFLKNDICIIYPVRPIVCRLQGNIKELPCEYNKNRFISKSLVEDIKKKFFKLIEDIDGKDVFFSTRNITLKK